MRYKFLLIVCFACLFCTQQILAAESEPNDTRAQANTLALNGSNSGVISTATDVDWFKVTTNGDGRLDVTLSTSNGLYTWFALYDNNGTTLLRQEYTNSSYSYSVDGLAAGTYYIRVYPYYFGQLPNYTLSNVLVKPSIANDTEPNGTLATAITLAVNSTVTGHVGYYYNNLRDTFDYYKLTTAADGRIQLKITSGNGQNLYATLIDTQGSIVLNSQYTTGTLDINTEGLAAGVYYVRINTYYTSSEFTPYTLVNSLLPPTQANDAEPNGTKAQALILPVNSTKTGHVNYYNNNLKDSADWYKIITPQDGMLKIKLTSANGQNVWAYLLDNNGTTVIASQYTTSTLNYNVDGLTAGTYYLRVNTYYTSEFAPYTITDSLYTYNTSDAEPNKYAKQAATLPANQTSTGHVGFYYNNDRDTVDWHKINYTGTGALTLTFTLAAHKSDGATNYGYIQVYKDTAAAPIFNNYYSGTQDNVISLSSLTQGYYYIKIFEYYSNNFDAYSILPTFTQANIAGVNITQTISAGCTDGQLKVQCSGSSAPYKVELYNFGTLAKTVTVPSTAVTTITGLAPGKYYARAYGDGATGSAYGTSSTKNIPPPSPTNTSESNITAVKATLNWTGITCANGYGVQYRVKGTTVFSQKIVLGNKTNLTLTGLTANTTYEWKVAAAVGTDTISNFVPSAFTAIDEFTTSAAFASVTNGNSNALKLNGNLVLSVAPNPASDYFVIQSPVINGKAIAQLRDVNGRIQWTSGAVAGSDLQGKRVNVSNLAAGLYMLEIINDKGSLHASAKVMVVK